MPSAWHNAIECLAASNKAAISQTEPKLLSFLDLVRVRQYTKSELQVQDPPQRSLSVEPASTSPSMSRGKNHVSE